MYLNAGWYAVAHKFDLARQDAQFYRFELDNCGSKEQQRFLGVLAITAPVVGTRRGVLD